MIYICEITSVFAENNYMKVVIMTKLQTKELATMEPKITADTALVLYFHF